MKKFGKTTWEENERHWGEIVLFREPENEENKNPDKLKVIDSSNVSIMANTAFMEPEFSLWHLGSQWKKDVYLGHDENYIDLKSVVRGSLIVRVPQNNPRIKNQQGAFIIVNANNIYLENNPDILKASRKQRIAKGCGLSVADVNQLLKQFEDMKKMMKMIGNKNFKMPF